MSVIHGYSPNSENPSPHASETEDPSGLIGDETVVVEAKGQSSKAWFIVAIAIGSLIVVGVGGFGITGLLQSHGLIALPHSFQWLVSAIGTVGATPHFWSLWSIAVGGVLAGGALIAYGSYKIHQARKKLHYILETPSPIQGSSVKPPAAPADVIAQLPKWLQEGAARLPYQKLPGRIILFSSLGSSTDPILLCSAQETIGIYMRIRVQHLRTAYPQNELGKPCEGPFTLDCLAYPPDLRNNSWGLIVNDVSLSFPGTHRGRFCNPSDLLQAKRFGFDGAETPLEPTTLENFINTKNQDALPELYRFHLGWILLRLLNGKDLEVREKKADCAYHSFDDPAIGHWQISIDRQT